MDAPSPLLPKSVLGVAAHPDDLDFSAGGTMAVFARQGAEVYYLILTDGGKGSSDRATTSEALRDKRRQEQREACGALGVKDVFFCNYPDGMLENTVDVKRDVVRAIRRVKPDVVVALDPSVLYVVSHGMINHPDHRAAGQAALDAVYPLARDHMAFPELLAEGLEPHVVRTLLLAGFHPEWGDNIIDITDTLEYKLQALAAHASQFGDASHIQELARTHAVTSGKRQSYHYGESFVRVDVR